MFKQVFWRGLKVTIPLAVTIILTIWVIIGIESFFGFLLKLLIGPSLYFPGLGFIIGLALIFCIGLIIDRWYIRTLHSWSEKLLRKIPIIKTLYFSLSDLMGFFEPHNNQSRGSPVMIKYTWGHVMGFVTSDDPNRQPLELQDRDLIGVYIPFSYQMGGTLVFVPKDSITPISMPVDQMMGFILSAGLASPQRPVIQS